MGNKWICSSQNANTTPDVLACVPERHREISQRIADVKASWKTKSCGHTSVLARTREISRRGKYGEIIVLS